MWTQFEGGHDKILVDVIQQVKGSIFLSAADIDSVKGKAFVKLTPLLTDMRQHFSNYRLSLQTHLEAILKFELKLIIDQKLGQLGLNSDNKNAQPLEPISVISSELENFKQTMDHKIEAKLDDFAARVKKIEQNLNISEDKKLKIEPEQDDQLTKMLKTKPERAAE